jgi:tRNA A-37 threonylcarbamoyl transferase component Bud32
MSLVGQNFGRYQVIELLGRGGMATVYKAQDTRLDRQVAIKIIRRDAFAAEQTEMLLKRFEREAKSLARLSHPNIMKVLDFGEHDGSPYLVMEYLPGGTLREKMGRQVPWQEAAQLILPIAESLDYAHSQNMIHRDVKPANVLLTQRGQPMLTDFGIAKILNLEETLELTGTSAAIGTPEYMAPEQASAKSVDHRVDIYSLGIVLYEMVTGRKPFIADTPMAVLIKHATEPLPRPKQFVPDLPDGVEAILLKMLAKDPQQRYPDMHAVIDALQGLLGTKPQITVVEETVSLPRDLIEAVDDPRTFVREGAIGQLEKFARGTNPALARSACALLEKLAAEDDSRRVMELAAEVLESVRGKKPFGSKFGKDGVTQYGRARRGGQRGLGCGVGVLISAVLLALVCIVGLFAASPFVRVGESSEPVFRGISNLRVPPFSATDDIYVYFNPDEVEKVQTFEAKWYRHVSLMDYELYILIGQVDYTASSLAEVYFHLKNPGLAGDYLVEIYIDQSLVGTTNFEIFPASP